MTGNRSAIFADFFPFLFFFASTDFPLLPLYYNRFYFLRFPFLFPPREKGKGPITIKGKGYDTFFCFRLSPVLRSDPHTAQNAAAVASRKKNPSLFFFISCGEAVRS